MNISTILCTMLVCFYISINNHSHTLNKFNAEKFVCVNLFVFKQCVMTQMTSVQQKL